MRQLPDKPLASCGRMPSDIDGDGQVGGEREPVAASSVCPGFTSVYEWIDYWEAGNEQHIKDKLSQSEARDDLAWAAQSLSHLIATMREIAELDYSRAAIIGAAHDAVRKARNALAEYGL